MYVSISTVFLNPGQN